ncbi:MAG: class I mannose-6-phosphate isomerase [Candidatus Pacebacteria bacterium]|nr:class I mannose-6-phosphate isomerase [Candidatus Paceibacterota bacterium]
MMQCVAYPLLLRPVYKNYIWGGTRIAERYGRSETPDSCAESWEVSNRPEGMSVVQNGPLAGKTLHELVASCGPDLVGAKGRPDHFPLLIKLIDARERLSLQVHPNDETAAIYGGEAKTEAWYVVDADPDAKVYAGLRNPTSADTLREAIQSGGVEDMLTELPARPGKASYISGGRLHAIGEGCLLLEVQQSSNTTYRVYDWGRVDHDGTPRELHIDEAMRVIDWGDTSAVFTDPRLVAEHDGNAWWDVVTSPYFRVQKARLTAAENVLHTQDSFTVLFVTTGTVAVSANGMEERLAPGTSCLIPAAAESYDLRPFGTSELIAIRA